MIMILIRDDKNEPPHGSLVLSGVSGVRKVKENQLKGEAQTQENT